MPAKADRKHLEATVTAFHAHYSSDANWGNERWHGSLYPALSKPTRYAALVNQYIPRAELDKALSTVSEGNLRPVQLPKVPSDAQESAASKPTIILYERVQAAHEPKPTPDAIEKPTKEDEAFLFPVPHPVPSPSNPGKDLFSHWNMDAASALSAHMLDVRPNDRVLDLCAAPGGKSVTLAQLIFPHLHADSPSKPPTTLGCLHTNEMDHARNKRLASNLRAYLPEVLFESNAVRVLRLDGADVRSVTQIPCGPGGYDRVLLDAPCSSERHIVHAHVRAAAGGRIADEMARWRKGGSKTLAKLQTDLLMTALRAVKIGGRVVYSTCSIETGENDGVVEKMLAALEKERKKFGLTWKVKCELGSLRKRKQGAAEVDQSLERLTEETKYGRIAIPDHKHGGQWGPLYICVLTKVARKA